MDPTGMGLKQNKTARTWRVEWRTIWRSCFPINIGFVIALAGAKLVGRKDVEILGRGGAHSGDVDILGTTWDDESS